ncbi:hypothetical protein, partial [Odoribacter splanchnicus]|uniref:hypothetical protein n=1 Tax=Odoribacter splanchnicus TaxID=28118 RepID=UPI001C6FF1F4
LYMPSYFLGTFTEYPWLGTERASSRLGIIDIRTSYVSVATIVLISYLKIVSFLAFRTRNSNASTFC